MGLEVDLNGMHISEAKNTKIILKEYERDESNVPLYEEDIQDGAGMAKMAFTDNYNEEHCDSLEVFCQHRISNTNQALQQVLPFIIESVIHIKRQFRFKTF